MIIGASWFTGRETIGIVVTENEVKERKAYIGVGLGKNEKEDAESISHYGSKIRIEILEKILTLLQK